MSWTEDRVELLKNLWAEGLSASQIAAQIGGISRNAVIGKVHRLKLSSRGRATPPPGRQKKAARDAAPAPRGNVRPVIQQKAAVTASVVGATALQSQFEAETAVVIAAPVPVNPVVVPISRRLALTELTERTCKWPIGDPLSEDFHFCGNDAGEASPYCAYHARLAFQPAAERRRR